MENLFKLLTLNFKGLLQTKDGIVIKPEQTRDKGDEEHLFFKRIFLDNPDKPLNDDEICLRKFLPTYLGQYEHENGNVKMKIYDQPWSTKTLI